MKNVFSLTSRLMRTKKSKVPEGPEQPVRPKLMAGSPATTLPPPSKLSSRACNVTNKSNGTTSAQINTKLNSVLGNFNNLTSANLSNPILPSMFEALVPNHLNLLHSSNGYIRNAMLAAAAAGFLPSTAIGVGSLSGAVIPPLLPFFDPSLLDPSLDSAFPADITRLSTQNQEQVRKDFNPTMDLCGGVNAFNPPTGAVATAVCATSSLVLPKEESLNTQAPAEPTNSSTTPFTHEKLTPPCGNENDVAAILSAAGFQTADAESNTFSVTRVSSSEPPLPDSIMLDPIPVTYASSSEEGTGTSFS